MRKKFFINPPLQIKHLTWTLVVACLGCLVGYMVFESMVASILRTSPLPPGDWLAIRDALRAGFLVVLGVFVVAIGIEHYFLFHRVVGPLFALQRGLNQMSEGNFEGEIVLRTDDELKDLIAAFETFKKSVRTKFMAYDEICVSLEKDLDEILKSGSPQKIKELKDRVRSLRRSKTEKEAA